MTTDVRAATWLYFSKVKPGDRVGFLSDDPSDFTPLSAYEGDQMSTMGLGYVSLTIGGKETIGIEFSGTLDQYWSDLICYLPQVLKGETLNFVFAEAMARGGVFTPLPGGRIRFDRDEIVDSLGDVVAPAVSTTADRAALANALAEGAQAWHDFCERVDETDYAGPIFQEWIDAVRAAI